MKTKYVQYSYLCLLILFQLVNTYVVGQTLRFKDSRVIEAVFSKEQIQQLTNPQTSSRCSNCVVAGVIFKVGKNQFKIPKTKRLPNGQIVQELVVIQETEYLEAFRVEWDGAGGVYLFRGDGSPLQRSNNLSGIMGGNLKTNEKLGLEFENTRTFDFVFFDEPTLSSILNYQTTTNGIVFSRIVLDGTSANIRKFQSLRAAPNPQPPLGTDRRTGEQFSVTDADAVAYAVGFACPPVWKEQVIFTPFTLTIKPLKKGVLFDAIKAIFGN